MTVEQITAAMLPGFLRVPAGSATASKGLLAVVAACGGRDVVAAGRALPAGVVRPAGGPGQGADRDAGVGGPPERHPAGAVHRLPVPDQVLPGRGGRARPRRWRSARAGPSTSSPTAPSRPAGFDDDGVLELPYGPRTFTAQLRPTSPWSCTTPTARRSRPCRPRGSRTTPTRPRSPRRRSSPRRRTSRGSRRCRHNGSTRRCAPNALDGRGLAALPAAAPRGRPRRPPAGLGRHRRGRFRALGLPSARRRQPHRRRRQRGRAAGRRPGAGRARQPAHRRPGRALGRAPRRLRGDPAVRAARARGARGDVGDALDAGDHGLQRSRARGVLSAGAGRQASATRAARARTADGSSPTTSGSRPWGSSPPSTSPATGCPRRTGRSR